LTLLEARFILLEYSKDVRVIGIPKEKFISRNLLII